jgi:hypothetical protein
LGSLTSDEAPRRFGGGLRIFDFVVSRKLPAPNHGLANKANDDEKKCGKHLNRFYRAAYQAVNL